MVRKPAKEKLLQAPLSGVACFKRDKRTDIKYQFGQDSWTAIECSTLIIREMKRIATSHLKEEPTRAVISVPAYFRDSQRKATLEAAQIAGLEVERIINEPTAAALAFGHNHSVRI